MDSNRVDYIAIFDVSSVFFQSDPFGLLLGQTPPPGMSDLYVFTEKRGEKIRNMANVAATTSSCFGISITKEIQDNTLLTPRAVAGSYAAIKTYLQRMKAILLNKDESEEGDLPLKLTESKYLLSDIPTCEKEGLDTVAHNLLVYEGLLNSPFPLSVNINVQGTEDEPFLTYISSLEFSNIRQNSLNNNTSEAFDKRSGELVSVVIDYSHNFIFSQSVMETYLAFYSSNLNASLTEYKQTSTCSNYTFVHSRDVFYKVCDLISIQALSLASCCHLCNSHSVKGTSGKAGQGQGAKCNGFTFLYGENSCQLKSCLEKDIRDVIHSDIQEGGGRMINYRPISTGGASAYLTPVDTNDDGISRSNYIVDRTSGRTT